jgi:hypothetical protein
VVVPGRRLRPPVMLGPMVVEARSRPVCLDLGLAGLAGLLDLWVRGYEHGLPLPPWPIVASGGAWSGPVALLCGPAHSCLEELCWASDCLAVVMGDVLSRSVGLGPSASACSAG